MKRIKQIDKISRKGNKKKLIEYLERVIKKIMPSGPGGGDRPAFWRKPEIQKKGEGSKGGK